MKKETIALILFIIAILLFVFGCKSSHLICQKTPRVVYTTDFKYDLRPLHEQLKCCDFKDCWEL